MKILFRVLRFLASYLVSGVAVYMSGYGNLMEDVMPDVAARTFLLSTVVISIMLFLIWEIYLDYKNKIAELSRRIDKLVNDDKVDK